MFSSMSYVSAFRWEMEGSSGLPEQQGDRFQMPFDADAFHDHLDGIPFAADQDVFGQPEMIPVSVQSERKDLVSL
jgi:hypothetical protein